MAKRLVGIMSIVLALLLIVTACAKSDSEETKDTTAKETTEKDTTSKDTEPVEEEPTEVTMFFQTGGQKFPDGFKFEDDEYWQRICEMANIKVTELTVPAYAYTQTKFNLMMSSGNIPDLVERASLQAMKKYGMEGAFLPTEDIIRNSPVLSQQYDDTQINAMKSEDGTAYIITCQPLEADYFHLAIRKDLLDETGLDIPETTDEFLNVCRELKKKYPNSIPIVVRGALWAFMEPVFGSFTRNSIGWSYDWDTGKVANSFEGDNIVKAVEYAKKLYDEGLLDPEFITVGSAEYFPKIIDEQNKVFAYSRNSGSLNYMIRQYLSTGQTEARVIPIAFPKAEGISYKFYQPKRLTGVYAFGINSKIKDKTLKGVIRYLETLYNDEIKEMVLYGIEGKDFTWDGDNRVPVVSEAAMQRGAYRPIYSWMYINSMEQIQYKNTVGIYQFDSLSDQEKSDYLDLVNKYDGAMREEVYGKVGIDPNTLTARQLPDDLFNKLNQCNEEQKALMAKTIIGEMSIGEFKAEKDKILAKYQDVTDEYNDIVKESREMNGLDIKGFFK